MQRDEMERENREHPEAGSGNWEGKEASAGHRMLASIPPSPTGSMPYHPVRQGAVKSDVVPGFFRLDPLVPQDFVPFGEEILVQGRVLQRFFHSHRRQRHVTALIAFKLARCGAI